GVAVVGRLEAFWIPVSDFHVTPVVALAERAPLMEPDPREVARIVEPRLAHFLPDAPIAVVERTIDGWPLRYGAFDVDGLFVWGATARILSQLGALFADR
ncbi:MAG: coenzyme A pyrophosphatase, partial [Chloroflexota bacterium]|nr:coenzyme A pyrophosphatase [Chloroflexota bacterium]